METSTNTYELFMGIDGVSLHAIVAVWVSSSVIIVTAM